MPRLFHSCDKEGFSRSAYFHKPYFIILDLAVGGDFTGITSPAGVTALPNDGSEAQMLVDYIRVYQQKDQECYDRHQTSFSRRPRYRQWLV